MRNIVNKTKASEIRFKSLFKVIPIPTYSWQKIDDDLILIDYNAAAEKITNGMIKDYVDKKASEMYINQPEILEDLNRCATDKVSIFREMKYGYMSTGVDKFLSVKYGFIPPDLVIVHTEDITEKKTFLERLKKSEKELQALNLKLKQKNDMSEEKYKTIFENTGTATIIVEDDTTISLINGQFEELSGYSREEIEWKKSWTEFVSKEDLERMKKLHYSRRKDPESTLRKYEFRFVNREGNIRNILIVIDLIPGTKRSVASLLDITASKKTEIAKQELYENFIDLVNNSPDGIIIADENGCHLFANQRAAEITGYNIDELVGMSGWELTRPEEIKKYKERLKKRLGSEPHKNVYERIIVRKDGSELLTEFRTSKTIWKGVIVPMTVIRDITERKRAEEKLKDSEEKYRYLFDNAQVGLYWSRISDGKFLECNDTFAKLFGYDTREEFLADYNAIEHYIDPNARNKLIDKKKVENYEIHVTRRDGTPIWLNISARIFEKEDRFEGAAIDITGRKKAEKKLKESEEKSRNLIDGISSVGIGIDIVSKDYKVLFQNQVLKEKFGELTGKICYKNYMGLKAPCGSCPMINALKNNRTESTELIAANGNSYEIFSAPYLGSDRNTDKVIEIVMNITERKQAERALRESEEKYREAFNRAEFYKDIFAHDINNILQSILAGTQISQLILDNPEKLDELKINAEIIKDQVVRGSKLVSNVRKISKLEEKGRSLEKIEILKVLKNTVSFVKKSYKNKNLAIQVDSVDENLFIKANDFLEDVFENLLINAIRHNKNLIIENTVRISRVRKGGIRYLKMEFLDNGLGVDDSMKERIFQRGYSKEKGVYGMGLGLSLVRGIIEIYNGEVWVEDKVEGDRSKGSNFVLLIPEVV